MTANATRMGLSRRSASNLECRRVAEALEAGVVWINAGGRDLALHWRVKHSGRGEGGDGRLFLDEYKKVCFCY
jgi:acyl-CoA reductase-like NAD-dependent aldehyde dehydrogenase